MEWKVVGRMNAKVVSNRATELNLPGCPQTAIRQIVVRLKSQQILQTRKKELANPPGKQRKKSRPIVWTPDAEGPPETNEFKELDSMSAPRSTENVTEYLVLQKLVLRGTEGAWKVQGFASETTLESLEADEKYERDMIEYQM